MKLFLDLFKSINGLKQLSKKLKLPFRVLTALNLTFQISDLLKWMYPLRYPTAMFSIN